MFDGRQGGLFTGAQDVGLRSGKTAFQCQRVMDKAYQHMVRTQTARRLRQNAQRKSVGDDGTAFRHHQQPRFGGGAGLLRRPGKVLAEADALNGPAEGFELADNPPVISVAAGRRGKITRHGEGKPLYHKFAS